MTSDVLVLSPPIPKSVIQLPLRKLGISDLLSRGDESVASDGAAVGASMVVARAIEWTVVVIVKVMAKAMSPNRKSCMFIFGSLSSQFS